MRFFVQLFLSAIGVAIAAYLLPGVTVDDFITALIVSGLLAVLNYLVKPVLIIFTLPITILTLGFFLLVINAIIIIIADSVIPGFHVRGFWWALAFSLILSLINSVFNGLLKEQG